jgi:hypothetical protein
MERTMSRLSKIFGEANLTYRGVSPRSNECCYEQDLTPRWRGPDVMGDDSQAMGFICHRCGREYLPLYVENRRLMGSPGA